MLLKKNEIYDFFYFKKTRLSSIEKCFIRPIKKNGNKVATLAVMSHGYFAQSHFL